MVAARVDGDDCCEDGDVWRRLLLFWHWAFYKGCSGGSDGVVGSPYDHPYERRWSYGTPSFALAPLLRLPLDLLYLHITPFHVLA